MDLSDVPNILISRLFSGDPMPEDDIVLLCIEV